MEKLFTTNELAEFYNVTVQTIWRWRERGLPHIKINSRTIRYKKTEVDQWLENQNKK